MFNRISAWLKKSERLRRTRSELSNLTDRELADLGINRSDIDRISREAVGRTYPDYTYDRVLSEEEKYIISQNPQSIRDIEYHARNYQTTQAYSNRIWSPI